MSSGDAVELVTAFLWPVVIVVLAILYREPLTRLLDRLKSLQGPGGIRLEASADALLAQAEAKLEPIAGSDMTRGPATQALINQTATQPWWAVHQAWKLVRAAAKEATGEQASKFDNTPARMRYLRDEGTVNDDVLLLTQTLRGLYDDMRERPDQLTPAAAADFVEAAVKISQSLRVATAREN